MIKFSNDFRKQINHLKKIKKIKELNVKKRFKKIILISHNRAK